jgi:hypothetical protein
LIFSLACLFLELEESDDDVIIVESIVITTSNATIFTTIGKFIFLNPFLELEEED